MTLAVFSDIHGNLDALEAVLASPEMTAADRAICLGDVIGYGADPSRCIARARERASVILLGNHESAVCHPEELEYFNGYARMALEWTRDQLSPEELAFISGLPRSHREPPDFLFVHSSPRHPEEWTYVVGIDSARPEARAFAERVCFIGHSHVPLAFAIGPEGDPRHIEFPFTVDEEGTRYLVNVGSVGQPRDRDPRAAFVLYDDVERRVSLIRVSYALEEAQRKILAANLPPFLAARLAAGR